MKYVVIIPARYESSRFPGKPLAKIGGEEMIVRVCKQVVKAGVEAVVATDDQRIFDCVEKAGFKAVMTSSDHRSGTERVEEAYRELHSDPDVVINVQGDEPFIQPEQIKKIIEIFEKNPEAQLATLCKKFDAQYGFDALFDPNLVKVVYSENMKALYFSRSIIPYVRKTDWKNWLKEADFHTHIGIYGYKAETLSRIVKLPESSLEKAESLEQLRWLQNGYEINIALTEFSTIGIDTEADLRKAEEMLAGD
ncbi:MAG: 3-deoxy-manno-octulosonate cytidylyltransferase [Muribaculaceae bacterium]|nr:3-deoxy-manno-octulosonate cytidylyltransferase [Muribaculaceae bacterium]